MQSLTQVYTSKRIYKHTHKQIHIHMYARARTHTHTHKYTNTHTPCTRTYPNQTASTAKTNSAIHQPIPTKTFLPTYPYQTTQPHAHRPKPNKPLSNASHMPTWNNPTDLLHNCPRTETKLLTNKLTHPPTCPHTPTNSKTK